jgi:hypothetical protein
VPRARLAGARIVFRCFVLKSPTVIYYCWAKPPPAVGHRASACSAVLFLCDQKKFIIRSCPVTQAHEGAQIPPSHPPHCPLAKWSLRLAASDSDSLLRLHRHSVYDELDWVWVIACA